MNIAELTSALKSYVDRAQGDLEKILCEPVEEYLAAIVSDPDWLAAIMHTTGSEAEEAVRFSHVINRIGRGELADAVTRKLAAGIISSSLLPAVLPTPLLRGVNQSLLSCLRESSEGDLTFGGDEAPPAP